MEFVIDARHAWGEPLCGLPMVRRHGLLAERLGASPITVMSSATELAAIAGRLSGTRARVTAEADATLRRAAAAGAVVLPCERAVDLDAASALAERVRPG